MVGSAACGCSTEHKWSNTQKKGSRKRETQREREEREKLAGKARDYHSSKAATLRLLDPRPNFRMNPGKNEETRVKSFRSAAESGQKLRWIVTLRESALVHESAPLGIWISQHTQTHTHSLYTHKKPYSHYHRGIESGGQQWDSKANRCRWR